MKEEFKVLANALVDARQEWLAGYGNVTLSLSQVKEVLAPTSDLAASWELWQVGDFAHRARPAFAARGVLVTMLATLKGDSVALEVYDRGLLLGNGPKAAEVHPAVQELAKLVVAVLAPTFRGLGYYGNDMVAVYPGVLMDLCQSVNWAGGTPPADANEMHELLIEANPAFLELGAVSGPCYEFYRVDKDRVEAVEREVFNPQLV